MVTKTNQTELLQALIAQQEQILKILAGQDLGNLSKGNMRSGKSALNGFLGDISQKSEEAHQKLTATTGTAVNLHGNGGLFANSLERDVISAHVQTKGLAGVLPLFPSNVENPILGLLTGISDEIGSVPANPCSPAPTGYIKGCEITSQFGRLAQDTNVINISDVILKKNRGDFTDLMLRGQVLGLTDLNPVSLNQSDLLNIVTASEMINVGVRFTRKLNKLLWQGSVANNNVGGGYKEGPGLDNQIKTGIVDYSTNTACPAADSSILNFNFNPMSGASPNIVEYMQSMEYQLVHNAERMGMDPTTWVITMRPDAWYELTEIWPCRYNTNRCASATSGNSTVFLDGRQNISDRDMMRRSMTIDINSRTYPVVVDDGMYEYNSTTSGSVPAGSFASSICFVPLTIAGGFPVTYREYLDYRQAAIDVSLLRGKENFWTDDGVYMWVVDQNRLCYVLGGVTEQRVVLRAPQLAGRIDRVLYTPLTHLRDSDPASPYWKDGGVSLRGDSSFYAVWK